MHRLSSCDTQAQVLQQLWPVDLVTRQHEGSSRARDQTCVPCITRQILNHQTIREVPVFLNYALKCDIHIVKCVYC